MKPNIICQNCNKSFYRRPCLIGRYPNVFCTPECRKEWTRGPENPTFIEMPCAFCQKILKKRPCDFKYRKTGLAFCNTECLGLWRRKRTIFDGAWGKLTSNDYKNKVAFRTAVCQTARRVTNFLVPNPQCYNCGYSRHAECCHIKPVGGFPEGTQISEINRLDNLILLCPNCHWEFDNNILNIETIKRSKFYIPMTTDRLKPENLLFSDKMLIH